MILAFARCWPLFLGIALLMLAHGLQGTVIALRASIEGYSTVITGTIMTGFFSGYICGSLVVPRFVHAVGHIRVFAALVSIASCIILAQGSFVEPVTWIILRFAMGICIAGLYLIAESWLNDVATNQTRGQILSLYMLIVTGGIGTSQFLLNLGDPGGNTLFILISILISLSAVPMLLSTRQGPDIENKESVSVALLYKASPLGTVGIVAVGLVHASSFSMGAVYAKNLDFTVPQISIFLSCIFLGAMLLQWPIGWLSDRKDRRKVLICAAALAATAVLILTIAGDNIVVVFIAMALFGGFSMPLYSLCLAHTNDHLTPKQRVSASSVLVMLSSFGAAAGPFLCGWFMSWFGNFGYVLLLALGCAFISAFGVYRLSKRKSLPLESQDHYGTISSEGSAVITGLAMEPEADSENQPIEK